MSAPAQEQPNFTAFVVAIALIALARTPRGRVLVPASSLRLYTACAAACAKRSLSMRMLRFVPDAGKLWLFDRITAFGYSLHLALRKQAVEVQARSDLMRGVRQVVVIGAGFDALCSMLAAEFPEVMCYELDMAPTQQIKRAAMGEIPSNLHLIPCDLSRVALRDVMLAADGFAQDLPTLYIAEGLSMYLTEAENRAWLADVRRLSGQEARLLLSALETTSGSGALSAGVRDGFLKSHNTRFKWAIAREQMPEFLEESGFALKFARYFADMQAPYRTARQMTRLRAQPGEHVYCAAGRAEASH